MSAAGRPTAVPALERSWAQTGELVYQLVLKDLRVRYKSSFLGYLWALANPLAFATVYYVAFGFILTRGAVDNFALYLITGMFPWAWIANGLVHASGTYRHNASLVRKVRMQRAVLPLASVLQEMLHFLLAVPVLIVFAVAFTHTWHLTWLIWIPVVAILQLLLVYPIGLALAAANVLVRDVEYLVGISLQMLFFLTPIVYPASIVPAEYKPYFALNPFAPVIAAWRGVIEDGQLNLPAVAGILLFIAIASVVAVVVHRYVEPRIGELV